MSLSLSPYPRFKAFYPGTGNPLAGGMLWTCQPGTSGTGYLKATYTDATGQTQNTNPVILDSNGEAGVWLSGYTKLVLLTATGVPVWSVDNVSSMPNTASGITQWTPQVGITLTYVSSTQFSTAGDQTAMFQANQRVQAVVAAGTIYGTVQSSTSTGSPLATTVTVAWDSGQLDAGLSAISTGIITPQSNALPFSAAAQALLASPFVSIDSNLAGVAIGNNATNPTYQMDVTLVAPSASFTIDKSLTPGGGTNRLDTGTISNSTWYYIWAINNGTTTAGLLSLSSTSPLMTGVSGYTYKKLIGAIYVNSSGNFVTIAQINNKVMYPSLVTIWIATGASSAQLSATAIVPLTAKTISFDIYIANATVSVGPNSAFANYAVFSYPGTAIELFVAPVPLITPQSFYYEVSGAGSISGGACGWSY